MAVRALIIAIESYPQSKTGGLAQTLEGTLQAGRDFRDWLVAKWAAEGRDETQVLFCSEPPEPGGSGAGREEILTALDDLKNQPSRTTEELYVFFSGHGFMFADRPGNRADVIIASDFKSAKMSGHCCFKLDKMILWLRSYMGPGKHFYFVDACRNTIDATQIEVLDQPVFSDATQEEPTTYVLQSTLNGAVARVDGLFHRALMNGLKGQGRAKVWDASRDDAMVVRYDTLRAHLSAAMKNQPIENSVQGRLGESDGVLSVLRPTPTCKVSIEIADLAVGATGTITFDGFRAGLKNMPVSSASTTIDLEPDRYRIEAVIKGEALDPSNMMVEIYEDINVSFYKRKTTTTLRRPAAEYINAYIGHANQSLTLAMNTYLGYAINITLHDEDNLPMRSIRNILTRGQAFYFLDTLRMPILEPDLDVWLALIGSDRIVGSTEQHKKIAKLPLHDFSSERPGASPIYLLAGLEKRARLSVGLSTDSRPEWRKTTAVKGMAGVYEHVRATTPGPQLLSFSGGPFKAPWTIATQTMANRATLVTLTIDKAGQPRVGQYLLPIEHLIEAFPSDIRGLIARRNMLEDAYRLAQASRAFRNRKDIEAALTHEALSDLLYAKWLDPIAAAMAAYELIRRGSKDELQQMVRNMTTYFDTLPDTAALARLLGKTRLKPGGAPLFLDGVRAFTDRDGALPLPRAKLDYAGPWTVWLGAVAPPAKKSPRKREGAA